MNTYLVPITSQQQSLGGQNQTINAPKYLSTDLSGLSFAAIPFGGEPMCVLTLAAANAALSSEPDVYSFPADLTTTLADADVASLAAFLTAANVVSDQIVSGMTFAAALQVIAKIFLAAQALLGATGSAIFTNDATLDSTIADSGVASIVSSQTATLSGGAGTAMPVGGSTGGNQLSTPTGAFDFSSVASTDTIGATLDSVSQKFTAVVDFGVL